MMNVETVSLKLTRFTRITRLNKLLMFALLVFIVVFTIYNFTYFPLVGAKKSIPGFASEFINLIVIMTVFWVVQCSKLAKKAYQYVTIGLMLWIVGMTADVLDELVVQPQWVTLYIKDLCISVGVVITAYGLFKTMLFMQKMHNRLAQEFIVDDLTQVYNRRCFYEYVENETDESYAVIIIDIDHFKSINDTFGHDKGDKVLKAFASKIDALFEDGNIFARIGGEEFAGYLPNCTLEKMQAFAESVLASARTIEVTDELYTSASIGVAKRFKNESFDSVMKRADQALYKAKNSGRNRFVIATKP